MEKFDFSGWATRNDLKCSDGRTIRRDAFKHNDGRTVPLVWNHQHNDPLNVLGNATLEHRDEGVYAYCTFNDTESGQAAKNLVEHGDVSALSIYANRLQQRGGDVLHGEIREVSLVLSGANPGAFIDNIIRHGEEADDEAIIYSGEDISLYHAEEEKKEDADDGETVADVFNTLNEKQKTVVYALIGQALENASKGGEVKHADEESDDDETVEDVFNTLSEKQKTVVYALIGQAIEDSKGGNETMKHNVFDQDEIQEGNALTHSDMEVIFRDAKRCGSLKEAYLAHAESTNTEYTEVGTQNYGIAGADDWLFPEARLLNSPPEFIKRKTEWVSTVMHGVHHTPFSRIKSMFADITEDEARARGYIKGNLKKEEVFTLLKRTTTPTTIYKKQKMDRDDIIDITDFDVVAWLKSEMRMMLDEEIARAILVGDGRLSSSDDKINEMNIRPIWNDEDLYTIKVPVSVAADATDDQRTKAIIKAIVKSRKDYRGSGNPTMFTTEDYLTDMLLMEDNMGRIIYDSMDKLKAALRVSNIVTVPVMEGLTSDRGDLVCLIVNLKDYNVGADKGGAVNMFDDFDIDYNQQKYLIETRCSGALTKPHSAMAVELTIE